MPFTPSTGNILTEFEDICHRQSKWHYNFHGEKSKMKMTASHSIGPTQAEDLNITGTTCKILIFKKTPRSRSEGHVTFLSFVLPASDSIA